MSAIAMAVWTGQKPKLPVCSLPSSNWGMAATTYTGTDTTTSKGTEHFSLTDNDQINLSNLVEQIKNGATQVPYHVDGQLCRMFTAEEMTGVYQAADAGLHIGAYHFLRLGNAKAQEAEQLVANAT